MADSVTSLFHRIGVNLTDIRSLSGVGGKLTGLALVKRGSVISGSQTVWDISEFSADAKDVELDCLQQRRCGGVFRGLGSSCNAIECLGELILGARGLQP
jgi:hypothetical protein